MVEEGRELLRESARRKETCCLHSLSQGTSYVLLRDFAISRSCGDPSLCSRSLTNATSLSRSIMSILVCGWEVCDQPHALGILGRRVDAVARFGIGAIAGGSWCGGRGT